MRPIHLQPRAARLGGTGERAELGRRRLDPSLLCRPASPGHWPWQPLQRRPGTEQEKLGTGTCSRNSLLLRFICASGWGDPERRGSSDPFRQPSLSGPLIHPTCSVMSCPQADPSTSFQLFKKGEGQGSLTLYKQCVLLSSQILRTLNPCNLDKSDRHYQVRVKPPRMALQLIAKTAVIKS